MAKKAKEEMAQSSKPKEVVSNRGESKEEMTVPSSSDYENSETNINSEENKPKLHVLADDRLNSLINTANELGITDVIQVFTADRTGQFYLIYRE